MGGISSSVPGWIVADLNSLSIILDSSNLPSSITDLNCDVLEVDGAVEAAVIGNYATK